MRVFDHSCIDKEDLRRMPESELAHLGVRLVDRQQAVLQCTRCAETWAPQLDANGKLPFHYWMCPARCNA